MKYVLGLIGILMGLTACGGSVATVPVDRAWQLQYEQALEAAQSIHSEAVPSLVWGTSSIDGENIHVYFIFERPDGMLIHQRFWNTEPRLIDDGSAFRHQTADPDTSLLDALPVSDADSYQRAQQEQALYEKIKVGPQAIVETIKTVHSECTFTSAMIETSTDRIWWDVNVKDCAANSIGSIPEHDYVVDAETGLMTEK